MVKDAKECRVFDFALEQYPKMQEAGLENSDAFHWVGAVEALGAQGACDLHEPPDAADSGMALHPGAIEAGFQLLTWIFMDVSGAPTALWHAMGVARVFLNANASSSGLKCQFRLSNYSTEVFSGSFRILNDRSELLAELLDVRFGVLRPSSLPSSNSVEDGKPVMGHSQRILLQLERSNQRQRKELLESLISSEISIVLGSDSPDKVSRTAPLKDQGIDSLRSVELRNRLMATFGRKINLSSTAVLDYPTVEKLSEHILKQFPLVKPVPKDELTLFTNRPENLVERVADASRADEALKKLLDEEIESILKLRSG